MSLSNQVLAELLSDASFVRWIKGSASQQEQKRWEAWLKSDFRHRELKRKAEMLYRLRLPMESVEADDMEIQLNRLNERIDQSEEQRAKITPIKKVGAKRDSGRWGYWAAVAAVVVLLLSVVSVLTFYVSESPSPEDSAPLFTTIEVGYGEKGALKISDGSQIRLNSNSSLRYSPEQIGRGKIEVWLEGEAYFNIKHDPGGRERNFVVHTPNGDIRVLGTRFNVNTRFKETSVVLEEGRVHVQLKDSLRNSTAEAVMETGERAILSANSNDIVLQEIDVKLFTAWLDDKMEFYDTSLERIIASIEAVYGVTFDLENITLLEERITGSIQNPDLETLLSGLEKILDVNIDRIEEERFLITKQSDFTNEQRQ